MKDKLFEKLVTAYFMCEELEKVESFGSIVVNIAKGVFEKVIGSADFQIFEPIPIPVRGNHEKEIMSQPSFGNDKYRVFIWDCCGEISLTIKLIDWKKAKSAVLTKDDSVIAVVDFKGDEKTFDSLDAGNYAVFFKDKKDKNIGYFTIKLKGIGHED